MTAELRCVSCHKEHRGQHALAQVQDSHCISCHADLKRNDGAPSEFDPHILAFAPEKHPEFRLWKQGNARDPGTVRFNHQAHLDPEGVLEIDTEQLDRQLAKIKEQNLPPLLDIPREGKKRTRLECVDCHQMDPAGRFMQPVRFEQHCQRCHPLSVQLAGDFLKDPRLADAAHLFSRDPAPHPAPGQNAEMVRGVLRDRLVRFVQGRSALERKGFLEEREPDPPRPLPDRGPPQALSEREFQWVNRQQDAVERLLFRGAGGCHYCHQEKQIEAGSTDRLPEFLLPDIPGRWFGHALFSHKSHTLLKCTECHDAPRSERTSDVLMPRVETCYKCHNASEKSATAHSGCVECHLYHDPKTRYGIEGKYHTPPKRWGPPFTVRDVTGR
jgi:hypothetical protein